METGKNFKEYSPVKQDAIKYLGMKAVEESGLMPFFNQMNAMEKEIEKLQEENKKLRGIIRETIARRKELQ